MNHVRLFGLLLALAGAACLPAEEIKPAPAAAKSPTFIYVLHLVPRLHDDNAWTDADKQAVGEHFRRLKADTEQGKVIFAGRTLEPGATTFGIVVFEAATPADAEAYANRDPAVVGGVMRVDTHPFALVLQRK